MVVKVTGPENVPETTPLFVVIVKLPASDTALEIFRASTCRVSVELLRVSEEVPRALLFPSSSVPLSTSTGPVRVLE